MQPAFIEIGFGSVGGLHPDKFVRKQIRRSLKRLQPAAIPFAVKGDAAYRKASAQLKAVPLADSYAPDDAIVFGSDEIWNVARSVIRRLPALWGEGVAGGKKIAYAPSANGASLVDSEASASLKENLSSFAAISARDEWTAQQVASLTGRNAPVVCDPTLLLTAEEWQSHIQPQTKQLGSYALVYSYEGFMSPTTIAETQNEAHARGLQLVSGGQLLKWCDKSIPCGPFELLQLFKNADFVVTSTFHGTVLSTIFRKQFASYAYQNSKVSCYLTSVGLESRDASKRPLRNVLAETVPWSIFEQRLNPMRDESLAYLKEAVLG